jgi:hypothetical protein
MVIIDEIIITLISQSIPLLSIPNSNKYLYDYYFMIKYYSYTSILFKLINS